MKNNKITIFISSLTILLVVTVMCTFQLKVDEVAVVTTFGSPKSLNEPGLYFRWPWPVQKLVRLDTRKQLYQGNERETLTKDNINIILKVFVAWSIDKKDPLEFYKKVGERSADALRLMESLVESKQEIVIRSYELKDFFNSGGESKIEQIEAELSKALNEITKEKYGIAIHKTAISRISLHEKNSESVLSKMQQEQSKIASNILSKAETAAQLKKNEAEKVRRTRLAEAEAESKKIRDDVLAKSTDLFSKYQDDQEFAAFLRSLDALKQMTKTQATAIINTNIPPFDLFKKAIEGKSEE